MSVCNGCGATLLWGETPEGTKIPLDPNAPVYALVGGGPFEGTNLLRCVRLAKDKAMVSHFATCPKANEFSRSQKHAE